ncbi:hypothetical protein BRC2024_KCUCJSVR_CDS_0168 [Acinetobacter phage vB_AbaM_KissB]
MSHIRCVVSKLTLSLRRLSPVQHKSCWLLNMYFHQSS